MVGLAAVVNMLLYPYSEIVITASTIPQANVIVEKKIRDELIKKLDLTPVKYSQKKNAKTIEIKWCSLIDVERLYNFLYNNANIFLERKFNELNKFYCLGQYEV